MGMEKLPGEGVLNDRTLLDVMQQPRHIDVLNDLGCFTVQIVYCQCFL